MSVQRQFLLDIPFAERRVAQTAGARWSAAEKCYVFRGSSLPPALRKYWCQPYSYEKWLEHDTNKVRPAPSVPTRNIELREHQAQAVSLIRKAHHIGRVGFLLADDVGLGKTITGWKGMAVLPKIETILIVCPLAVIAHWRRTIQWLGDHGRRVMIINYDRLARLFSAPEIAVRKPGRSRRTGVRRPRRLKGIARFGHLRFTFDGIIFDESHRLRNPESARTKFATKLSNEAKFVLWASATAGQNPLELSYLAPLLAQMTGASARSLKDFEKWCQSEDLGVTREAFGQWVFNDDEAACKRVEELLFAGEIPAGVRRRPEDIAGWPEINRILMPIDLDPEQRRLYDETWAEFRAALALDGGGGKVASANGLVARLRFRQKSSLLRVSNTVSLVEMLRESGRQVAVSVAFVETMTAMKDMLEKAGHKVSTIYGAQGATEKEDQRLAFQNGQTQIVLFTVEESINLHEGEFNNVPRAEILHDLRWSAIQTVQIEGRTHRDGKSSPAYWCFGADTVEEDLANVVLQRILTMKTMQGDDTATLRAVEAMLKSRARSEAQARLAA